jgi:hypothetical protein
LAEMTEQRGPDRRLVHLVNYHDDQPVSRPVVEAAVPQGWRIESATILTPEETAPRPLKFRQRGDRVTFSPAQVGRYALVCLARKD